MNRTKLAWIKDAYNAQSNCYDPIYNAGERLEAISSSNKNVHDLIIYRMTRNEIVVVKL